MFQVYQILKRQQKKIQKKKNKLLTEFECSASCSRKNLQNILQKPAKILCFF